MEAAIQGNDQQDQGGNAAHFFSRKRVTEWLIWSLAIVGVGLFQVACALPVLQSKYDGDQMGTDVFWGWQVLLGAWLGVFTDPAFVLWSANPLALGGLICLWCKLQKSAFLMTLGALSLGLLACLLDHASTPDRYGHVWHTTILPGGWCWLTAIGAIWLSSLIAYFESSDSRETT